MTKAYPSSSPFGSIMPTRVWSDASRAYRYGFNGKEKDFETANDDYDFGARIYDGRLGRWLSVDPNIILPEIKTIGLVKKELNLTNQYDQTNKKEIYSGI